MSVGGHCFVLKAGDDSTCGIFKAKPHTCVHWLNQTPERIGKVTKMLYAIKLLAD